ncbi:hypothetical protein SCHPADRAFT_941225 [Schizopora paradoxa]|uniref:Transmembrane protein n=1 Tax=Schizopora paradoxa TaxID=27342 RepID=A0A0H2RSS0_9AGAM|nr:hypothetical protein SCHPADRAFT_941225 [Schizopora paradoxa]
MSSNDSSYSPSATFSNFPLTSLQTNSTPTLFITMRSFGLFTAVAAVACSIFASAAPVDVVAAGAGIAAVHARSPAVSVEVPGLEARELKSVVVVLTELQAAVKPVCADLNAIVAVNAKVEVIIPLLTKIVAAVNVAIGDLKLLVGADVSVILAAVDGTAVVALSVVATLLADILILILGALAHILLFVKVEVLGSVFVEVGTVLGLLVGGCGGLVGGLIELVIPLVVSVVAVVKVCVFTDLAAVLKIVL